MPVGQSPSLQYSSSMFDLHAVSSMLLWMHVTVVTVLTPGPHCAEQCDLGDFQATNLRGSHFSEPTPRSSFDEFFISIMIRIISVIWIMIDSMQRMKS